MSRNGSGTYTLPAGNPVVTGTTITTTWANNTLNDIASSLTGSVASDGQTPMSGNLNMASNKIVSLATPTASTDAATKDYVDTLVTGGSAGIFSSVTDTGLTSGRVTYATTGGLLTDDADMTFNGTNLTLANDASIAGVTIGKGKNSVATNTGLGVSALAAATLSGANNTAAGYQSGNALTSGSENTSYGSSTLVAGTTVTQNTAVGYQALKVSTVAGNTGIGWNAAYQTNSGTYNTAVGWQSLSTNSSGQFNAAIGANCLSTATGSNNTGCGYFSGKNVTTGANNAFFGYLAGTDAVANITTTSNNIVMGNNSHTNAYIKVAWTVTSDARDKTNIAPVTLGLDFVSKLNPVSYQFTDNRTDKTPTGDVRYGFLAQDILALEGDNPVIIDNKDPENLKYNSDSLIPALVKAIQELKAEIDILKA